MAGRPPKNTGETTKHYTKEELEKKKEAEAKIKGSLKVSKIKPPEYLKDKEETKIFKSISKDLIELGLFTQANVNLLGMYIKNLFRYNQINEILDKEGLEVITMDKIGNTIITPSPFLKALDTLENRIMKQEGLLNLTVQDRIRTLSLIGQEKEEEVDEFTKEIDEETKKALTTVLSDEQLDKMKEFIDKVGDI